MVNDLVFWLTMWLNFGNVLLTDMCLCHSLQQMKVCFNALKWCYDVSMNKTDYILPPPPPPPHWNERKGH